MQHLQDILTSAGSRLLTVPSLVLILLLVLSVWVLRLAQSRPDFEIGDILRDDRHKPSAAKFAVFISLGVSSYLVLEQSASAKDNPSYFLWIFGLYLITWSGSSVLEKVVGAWLDSKKLSTTPVEPQENKEK